MRQDWHFCPEENLLCLWTWELSYSRLSPVQALGGESVEAGCEAEHHRGTLSCDR